MILAPLRRGIFVTRIWELSPDENSFAYENFCAVISKWQSYIISKWTQNCIAHFEKTVHISFQNDWCRFAHFEMKVIDHLKMFNRLFSAGFLPIEFGQDSIDKNSEHAAGVQKTVSFEMSFKAIVDISFQNDWGSCRSFRNDSHRSSRKDWGRCRLFRRDSHISFQREHHFKITHFEGIIIYHF